MDILDPSDDVPLALRKKFLATLPERLAAIETAWEALPREDEARARLRLHVHRLAGATGSYGYPELHARACRFEHAIDAGAPPNEIEDLYLETCFGIEQLIR